MSGFNTKEKNNSGEYEITFYTDNHEDFKKVQDMCRNLIGHGKPVSTEGDLISREALKEELEAYRHTRNYKSDEDEAQNSLLDNVLEDIDNAPPVPQVTVFTENTDEKAIEDMKAELQSVIDNAPTASIKSCRECPFDADEEKQITNGDAWKSYCEEQEVGFKKAEDVFERMKLIQETVDCIRNTFKLDTKSDKLVRNCMALVQNAIDGEYHDMEEVDVSELERTQGEYIRKEDVIALMNKWADGYSYIEIPTEDAMKEIMEFNPRGDAE